MESSASPPQDGRDSELTAAVREILSEPEARAYLHRIAELRKERKLDL